MPSQPWIRGASLEESQVTLPTDIQTHLQQIIQTHAGVTVAPSTWNNSGWIDTDGFDKIAINLKNDAAVNSQITADWSHDNGSTIIGNETPLATSNGQTRATIIDTKCRYIRINVQNGDAASHVISTWAYLKA
jgi:hypothetical protein